jgi:hypothetical protein
MGLEGARQLTKDEVDARRRNSKKSTGPRTEFGKERVSVNAVKTGYYADKAAYAAMLALGEDPKEYAKIYADLVGWMLPQNEGQFMFVEDVAVMRWQQNRNQRGQAGLIGEAREALMRRHSQKWKTYEQLLDDAPQEQVLAHGIASLADSGRIVDLLAIAIRQAKKGKRRTRRWC